MRMDLSGTLGMSYYYSFKVMETLINAMRLSVQLTDFYYSQINAVGLFKKKLHAQQVEVLASCNEPAAI
jgi:hypothetical protein